MGDQKIGKKGFFTLSNLTHWLTEMLINLNPPLRRLERVPVRIAVTERRTLKK